MSAKFKMMTNVDGGHYLQAVPDIEEGINRGIAYIDTGDLNAYYTLRVYHPRVNGFNMEDRYIQNLSTDRVLAEKKAAELCEKHGWINNCAADFDLEAFGSHWNKSFTDMTIAAGVFTAGQSMRDRPFQEAADKNGFVEWARGEYKHLDTDELPTERFKNAWEANIWVFLKLVRDGVVTFIPKEEKARKELPATQWLDADAGDKVQLTGTVRFVKQIESYFGESTMFIVNCGENEVRFFTTAQAFNDIGVEAEITFTATVKSFDEYQGREFTNLNRPKLIK